MQFSKISVLFTLFKHQTKRRLFALGFICLVCVNCQPDPPHYLSYFDKFISSKVPITNAVIHITILSKTGAAMSQDWWKFGIQNETWFAQALIPDATNPKELVLRNASTVGESDTHVWNLGEQAVQLADKAYARNSNPWYISRQGKSQINLALRMGLPFPVGSKSWERNILTYYATKSIDLEGNDLATNAFEVKFDGPPGGPPETAIVNTAKIKPLLTIGYEYASTNKQLPRKFTAKTAEYTYIVEFLILEVGRADLDMTGGYVPSLFSKSGLPPAILIWTNNAHFTVTNRNIFAPAIPHSSGQRLPQIGLFLLYILPPVSALIVYGMYKQNRNKTGEH